MTELKTLKDFEFKAKSWAGAMANAGRKYTIEIDELKQEAIKWVKSIIRQCDIYSDCEICQQKVDSFKRFLNITEEDLK